jgi:hypothetical protein
VKLEDLHHDDIKWFGKSITPYAFRPIKIGIENEVEKKELN